MEAGLGYTVRTCLKKDKKSDLAKVELKIKTQVICLSSPPLPDIVLTQGFGAATTKLAAVTPERAATQVHYVSDPGQVCHIHSSIYPQGCPLWKVLTASLQR
jgi:hypothetical protein